MQAQDILTIFTSEDKEELKACMKNIILEQFKDDLEKCEYYMFDPQDFNDMATEVWNEVLDTFKEKLQKEMDKKVEKMADEMMKNLQAGGIK